MINPLLKGSTFLYLLITLSVIAGVSYVLGTSLCYFAICIRKTSNIVMFSFWKDVLTLIISSLALILGFIYFISRIQLEARTARNQRIRNRMNFILEELKKYDRYISEILNFNKTIDEETLGRIRYKLERSFELIELYLERNDKLLGFTNHELNDIISVNSYVNKNSEIMHMPLGELKQKDLTEIQYKYIDLLQDARSICISKLE